MNTRTAPELSPVSTNRRPLLDSTDGQLYATTFAPLVEGQDARLLLQPGRGIGIVPGIEIDYRGPTKRYRLRVLAYLVERGKRGKPKATSNRLSVRVIAIGADTVDGASRRRATSESEGAATASERIDELVPCTVCKGSGAVEIPGVCPECHGHAHGCADCEGSGRIDWSECRACHGRGRAPRAK